MKLISLLLATLLLAGCYKEKPRPTIPPVPASLPEAPAGFDTLTNGFTDQKTMDAALTQFIEDAGDELGPYFNARSCVDCHSNPIIGGNSQVVEHRIAPDDKDDGIAQATLVHDQAVPGFNQQVAPRDAINALRSSLNLMGDGFVEAVPDEELEAIASVNGGQFIHVQILESPGVTKIGRFGWKDQQATLLSFAGDADFNEKGVENSLVLAQLPQKSNGIEDQQTGSTVGCSDPTCEDIDFYAAFMRSLKAPPRGLITDEVKYGESVFDSIGCNSCHVDTLYTKGLKPRDVQFHPYSDYLLHNIGTGDKIAQGPAPANKLRTKPLWGLRVQSRFLHDNNAFNITDAIKKHRHEANDSEFAYERLTKKDKQALLTFLNSL